MRGRGRWLVIVALVALALLGGCRRRVRVGQFGRGAFYHAQDHYRVRYGAGDTRLLPPPWQLRNWVLDDEGRPRRAHTDRRWFVRYQSAPHGRPAGRGIRLPRVDLLFERSWPGARAVLWALTLPLDDVWAARDAHAVLDTVMQDVRARRSTLTIVAEEALLLPPASVEILGRGPAIVDARPAAYVSFDAAPSEGAPLRRITVVAVDSGRITTIGGRPFPLLVTFGVASPPQAHDEARAALAALVRRVDLSVTP